MKTWNPVAALGTFVLACAVACGDDGGREPSDAGAESGAAGASRGGSAGRGGAVSGSAGATSPGIAGARAEGGTTAQGGTTAEGGQPAEPGGASARGGAPTVAPTGGATQQGGRATSEPDAGAGGDAVEPPGGAPGEAGAGGIGGIPTSGGSIGAGGTRPSTGGSAQGGFIAQAGAAGAEQSGGGGVGGEGGSGDSGAGGAPTLAACGDGVLSSGEFCCTPEWVEERVAAAVELWEENAVGLTGCVPPTQQGLSTACGSAACADGAIGCGTEVTRATFDYAPERRQVDGLMDVVVRGQAALLLVACNFVATMDDLRFRADVLTEVTAEQLRIGIAEPDTAFDVVVQGCTSVSGTIADAVRSNAEQWVREQLVQQLTVTDACPY